MMMLEDRGADAPHAILHRLAIMPWIWCVGFCPSTYSLVLPLFEAWRAIRKRKLYPQGTTKGCFVCSMPRIAGTLPLAGIHAATMPVSSQPMSPLNAPAVQSPRCNTTFADPYTVGSR